MEKFVPKEKMSKKLRKKLDAQRRTLWTVNPVTKKTESAKLYNRKKSSHDRYEDYGMGVFYCLAI